MIQGLLSSGPEIAQACGQFLKDLQDKKIDFPTFKKMVLSLGVHSGPREPIAQRLKDLEAQYVKYKHDEETAATIRQGIAHAKAELFAWDFWASECQSVGVPIRFVAPIGQESTISGETSQ